MSVALEHQESQQTDLEIFLIIFFTVCQWDGSNQYFGQSVVIISFFSLCKNNL
jgi:hypothetical protein